MLELAVDSGLIAQIGLAAGSGLIVEIGQAVELETVQIEQAAGSG